MKRATKLKGGALAGTIRLGDLTVNRLGFGAMHLCGGLVWGRPRDRGHVNRVLHRAIELGVNFIDTADSYGPETNELMISEALYPYPLGLVIATKGGLVRPSPRSWVPDGRPDHLRRAIEGSLQRLRLERIVRESQARTKSPSQRSRRSWPVMMQRLPSRLTALVEGAALS
jgi:pyridoxine 4-dehydrogenase